MNAMAMVSPITFRNKRQVFPTGRRKQLRDTTTEPNFPIAVQEVAGRNPNRYRQ